MCRQFHCLPSALYQEDTELIGLLAIEGFGLEVEQDG